MSIFENIPENISNLDTESKTNLQIFKMFSSNLETCNKRIKLINESFLETIKNYDDYLKNRNELIEIISGFQKDLETLKSSLFSIIQSYHKLTIQNENLYQTINSNNIKIKEMTLENSRLNFQNDIFKSQVKYYKRQNLAKDNFIFELNQRINVLEFENNEKKIQEVDLEMNRNLDNNTAHKENISLNLNQDSYNYYTNVTLPKRIIRKKNNEQDRKKKVINDLEKLNDMDMNLIMSKYGKNILKDISFGNLNEEILSNIEKDIEKINNQNNNTRIKNEVNREMNNNRMVNYKKITDNLKRISTK